MALLHSLWQGAALGLVVALLLGLLRQQAALVRYRLAALALATLAGLLVVTFGYYYLAPAARGDASAPLVAATTTDAAGVVKVQLSNAVGWKLAALRNVARQQLGPCLPLVAGLWLLGFGAMSLRLLLGGGPGPALAPHPAAGGAGRVAAAPRLPGPPGWSGSPGAGIAVGAGEFAAGYWQHQAPYFAAAGLA